MPAELAKAFQSNFKVTQAQIPGLAAATTGLIQAVVFMTKQQ